MASLEELLVPKTVEETVENITTIMGEKGLPIGSYDSGSLPTVTTGALSVVLEDLFQAVAVAAASRVLEKSSGADLMSLAFDLYLTERIPSEFTQGQLLLEDSSSTGPYTIAAGDLRVQSANGLQYSNIDGGTLVLDGALILTFKAAEAGPTYNGVDTDTAGWSFVSNPLPGVTISNPAVDDSTSWITIAGRNEEEDAPLKERCRARWPSIGFGTTAEAWVRYAKKANASVTRVKVITNPGGAPGVTQLVIAGTDGAVSSEIVDDVQEQLEPLATNCTSVEVISAVNREITLLGTVKVLSSGYIEPVEDKLPIVLDEEENKLGIGSIVYMSPLICAIQGIDSDIGAVVSVELDDYVAIELEPTEVAKIISTSLEVVI